MSISLYDHQKTAIDLLRTGSILCGGVGSGKSRTALAYYFLKECKGQIGINQKGRYGSMQSPKDLYIITTARKRDTLDWEEECVHFLLSTNPEVCAGGVSVNIDSWNNIKKYEGVKDAFFIFDEQRVVGSGAWVKSFLKITKQNNWILLSATPGDTWIDYIPVFVANGFYKNKTEFIRRHVIYNHRAKWPKVDRYIECNHLERLRRQITINMEYKKRTIPHDISLIAQHDKDLLKYIMAKRWNIYKEKPIRNAAEFCYILRKVVNSDPSRLQIVYDLYLKHKKIIVFYNYDYELELLKTFCKKEKIIFSEWNGHQHDVIPCADAWIYLVQYTAGAEGWNCVETNVVVFYSQNYSYKLTTQAAGRIDRLNSPFIDLYYYKIRSVAGIDVAILKALKNKQNFNAQKYFAAKT